MYSHVAKMLSVLLGKGKFKRRYSFHIVKEKMLNFPNSLFRIVYECKWNLIMSCTYRSHHDINNKTSFYLFIDLLRVALA